MFIDDKNFMFEPPSPNSYHCSCRSDANSFVFLVSPCVSGTKYSVVAFSVVVSAVGVEGAVGTFTITSVTINLFDLIEK